MRSNTDTRIHVAEGKLAKLVLKTDNKDKIEALMKAASRDANTPSFATLIAAAEEAEDQLAEADIPKADRAGCEFRYASPGASSKHYRYPKRGPAFNLRRGSTGWTIISFGSHSQWPEAKEVDDIKLSVAAMRAFVREKLKESSFIAPKITPREPDAVQCPSCRQVFWPGDVLIADEDAAVLDALVEPLKDAA
ncbi:hypothetical protein ACIKTA_06880 [Hansschlegelia beijingensis]